MIDFQHFSVPERIINTFYNFGQSDENVKQVTVYSEFFDKHFTKDRDPEKGFLNQFGIVNHGLNFPVTQNAEFLKQESKGTATLTYYDGTRVVRDWKYVPASLFTTQNILLAGDDKVGQRLSDDVKLLTGCHWEHKQNGTLFGLPVVYPEALGYLATPLERMDDDEAEKGIPGRVCWSVAYEKDENENFVFYGPGPHDICDEEFKFVVGEYSETLNDPPSSFEVPVARSVRQSGDVPVYDGQGGGSTEPLPRPYMDQVLYHDIERDVYWPVEWTVVPSISYSQQSGMAPTYECLLKASMIALFLLNEKERGRDIPKQYLTSDGLIRIPVRPLNGSWQLTAQANEFFFVEVQASHIVNTALKGVYVTREGVLTESKTGSVVPMGSVKAQGSFALSLAYLFAASQSHSFADLITCLSSITKEIGDFSPRAEELEMTLASFHSPAVRLRTFKRSEVENEKIYLIGFDGPGDAKGDGSDRWVAAFVEDGTLKCAFDPNTDLAGRMEYGADCTGLIASQDCTVLEVSYVRS